MSTNEEKRFNAETFVDDLLEGGGLALCDESADSFKNLGELPEFYDEEKFKRGQKFFNDNFLAMMFSKFIGLLMTLSLPEVCALLFVTDNITMQHSAYKRFLATVFHVHVWYNEDFYPGSISWRSISEVRCRHNGASKRGISSGLKGITQGFMSMGQFGFMGIALIRSEMIGIHDAKPEDLEGYVHFWRCLGRAFGIDDRYNMCRESMDETRQICEALMSKVFIPEIEKLDDNFIKIATTVSKGMWCVNPMVEVHVFLAFVFKVCGLPRAHLGLNLWRRLHVKFIASVIASLKYPIFRRIMNRLQTWSIWIVQTVPFLAYYRFGYSRAHVTITVNKLAKKK